MQYRGGMYVYQWRVMKSKEEEEYGRRMAKEMDIPYIDDMDLERMDLGHPATHISQGDELHIDLNTRLNEAIELLKENPNKSFINFNGLMYCKLYPRYKGHQDEIVVMDLYWDNIRNDAIRNKNISISKGYSNK